MKKIYLLWPAVISYIITSISVFVTPGYYDGISYGYGFPFFWILVDKEITMKPWDFLADHLGISLGGFFIDMIVYMVIINLFILLYKVIFKKRNITLNK